MGSRVVDYRDHFVCCVLAGKWPSDAPERGPEYVRKLRDMVHKRVPGLPFICFTDREIPGVVTRYLPPWLPGWWGKIYTCASSNFPLGSRVFVMDLDTVIVGPLDDILAVPLDKPVFIREAWFNQHAGSGLFAFETSRDTARIWQDFPHGYVGGPPFPHPSGTLKGTDEHWFHHYIYPDGWRSWGEVVPGQVLNYKADLHQANLAPLPPDARVIYFDGEPRPHAVDAEWSPWGK